ncbi:MAG: FHA domain-containing protein [Treponema sp.]|nr:FHA domain-containing protein [Treponema sp.]
MSDTTIITSSNIGKHLEQISGKRDISILQFNQKTITLVEQLTIGRASDCNIIVDNKLASRHHAVIQRIQDSYYIKDMGSTNGTLVNNKKVPADKYIKLNKGDQITIGTSKMLVF